MDILVQGCFFRVHKNFMTPIAASDLSLPTEVSSLATSPAGRQWQDSIYHTYMGSDWSVSNVSLLLVPLRNCSFCEVVLFLHVSEVWSFCL